MDLIPTTIYYTTILYPIYWYGTSGEYSPDGSTTTDENDAIIWFSLSDNYELPVAYIGSDQIANIGETVFFDASSSNSSDGSILTKYEWDWDSDSTYDESYVTPEANHIWNTGGNHTVVLKVTDNYGESSIDSCIVTINHAKPVALFTYAPLKPLINEFITFDASSSYDLDGIIEIYKWDWNNDGIYDASFTTPVVLHSFSSDGDKHVTLKVYDNNGNSDKHSIIVHVFPVILTDNFDDYGLDTDYDLLYNYLRIETEVIISESREYNLSGILYYYNNSLGWWNSFDYEIYNAYFDIGVHPISLEFDGYKIHNLEYNGSFKAYLSVYNTTDGTKIDEIDYITQHYDYTESEENE